MFVPVLTVVLLLGVPSSKSENVSSSGFNLLLKMYDDCLKEDFIKCVKLKAVHIIDKASQKKEIVLSNDLTIIRDVPPSGIVLTENELENSLPGGSRDLKIQHLNGMLFEKISEFFNNHKIVFSLPKLDSNILSEEVEGNMFTSFLYKW